MSCGPSTVLFGLPARDIRRRNMQQFARKLQAEVARGRPFLCLITSDGELQRLNRTFRKKDYPTDVLSFAAGDATLGEIAISYHRARNQARDFAHSTEQEIQILMLHGLLHLIGLDHERDSGEMLIAERRWRRRFNLPSSLIERATA